MGLCECGCGRITNVYRGKSNRFIKGHQFKGKHLPKEHKDNISKSMKNIIFSEEHKNKISMSKIGHKHSEGTCKKIGKAHIDQIPWNNGKKCPEISERQTGEKNHMFGKTSQFKGIKRPESAGKNSPNWKGGRKIARARAHAKRKKLFGFIPINKPHPNYEGHHIDYNYVIFIPKELHKSIYHSVTQELNMNKINNAVYDWYLDFQGVL